MSGIGDLVARLSLDNSDFKTGANQAKSMVGGLSSSITSALGPIAASFAGAFALGSAVSGAKEAFAAEAKLTAVLAASGHAAGVSTEQIKAFAAQLQATTNFEDDATVSAAAMLASFSNIKGDQFTAVLASAADLATVMGGDLQSSVSLLGKALNDPEQGLTKLARAGVTFTDSQTAMIKSLVESGNIMGAQQIILGELEAKFKGAAAAVADPFTQLKNNLGDVGEAIGAGLLPALNTIAAVSSAWLKPMGDLLASNSFAIDRLTKVLTGATVAFVVLKGAVIAYATYQRLATISAITFQAVLNPALLLKVAAGMAIATAAVVAMDAAMANVAKAAPPTVAAVGEFGDEIDGIGDGVKKVKEVSDIMRDIEAMKIRTATGDDEQAATRLKYLNDKTVTGRQLMEYDQAVAAHEAMIAKKEEEKRAQDALNKSTQDAIDKQAEHKRLTAELDTQIAVLTGTMTKQEAAVAGMMRQGFSESEATSLAAKQAELDGLKESEAGKKAELKESAGGKKADTKTSLKAAFAGSSEAASIMLRGVGGGKTIEELAKKQLTVAQQQLLATKANKPQEMFAINFGA